MSGIQRIVVGQPLSALYSRVAPIQAHRHAECSSHGDKGPLSDLNLGSFRDSLNARSTSSRPNPLLIIGRGGYLLILITPWCTVCLLSQPQDALIVSKMTEVITEPTPPILQGPSDKEKKYDRQLRLWAASGQQALEDAHILLINSGSGTVGTETLKNLVLPGTSDF